MPRGVSLRSLRKRKAGQQRGRALTLKGQQRAGARRRALEVEASQADKRGQKVKARAIRKRMSRQRGN